MNVQAEEYAIIAREGVCATKVSEAQMAKEVQGFEQIVVVSYHMASSKAPNLDRQLLTRHIAQNLSSDIRISINEIKQDS